MKITPSQSVFLSPCIKKNPKPIHVTPACLGQSFFTVNICYDFQGLFYMTSVQLVLQPGRTQLSNAENHEAVAVRNQIVLTFLLTRFHLQFISEGDN